MKKKKFNFSGTIAFVIALLVLVIFVPINLITGYYDKVFDMTPTKRYTLNEKTVELLDNTSDKQIEVYYLSLLEYFMDAPEYLSLYHTLTQLDARENIKLTCFEPDSNPDLAASLNAGGNLETKSGDIFVRCGEVTKRIDHNKIFQKNADGVFQYAGEELIDAAIETCTSGSLPTIYFLKGHGEKSIEESYSVYANQLKTNNYDVQELNLDETGAIPKNAKIIYLAGPQSDLTDKETELIREYFEYGGAMSFLLAPCDTKGRFRNIEGLLEDFGIIMDYNYVTETNAANQLQNQEMKQSEEFMRVEYTKLSEDQTQDLTSEINYLVENGELIDGISGTRSFALIPETSFKNAADVEVMSIVGNAVNMDGSYSTKSTPMGGDAETVAEAKKLSDMNLDYGYYSMNKRSAAKIIVLGSTDVIDIDKISPSVSATQMLLTFSNTWLYDSDIQMGIGNKLNAYDSMKFRDANHARSVIVIVIVIPIFVAVLGVIVWLKRRHA